MNVSQSSNSSVLSPSERHRTSSTSSIVDMYNEDENHFFLELAQSVLAEDDEDDGGDDDFNDESVSSHLSFSGLDEENVHVLDQFQSIGPSKEKGKGVSFGTVTVIEYPSPENKSTVEATLCQYEYMKSLRAPSVPRKARTRHPRNPLLKLSQRQFAQLQIPSMADLSPKDIRPSFPTRTSSAEAA